ncbi:hypothetical protein [Sphingobacterium mizutaii]|uniref:hypothetical protein n=1 Tax=Sphingobacterium mizutaii TaxID=1010 RepID=UPI001626E043|nr:hypothetical protein [Sphingobacterium mizutaii]
MNKIQSWQELPFNKYIELSKITKTDELEKTIEYVAIINDLTIDEVREMKAKEFQILTEEIKFLNENPDFTKSTYQWKFKEMENITMDEFITYEKLKGDEDSMSYIVSFMTNTPENKIKEMSSTDVLYAFFLLKAHLDRFIKHLMQSLLWEVTKEKLNKKVKKLQFWRKN